MRSAAAAAARSARAASASWRRIGARAGPAHGRDAAPAAAAGVAAASLAGAAAIVWMPTPAQCYFQQAGDGSTDRITRWSSRSWNIRAGASPGFHLRTVNPMLERHWKTWAAGVSGDGDEAPSVLVPLCGKAVDMPFLCEQGFRVVGVEGVLRPILELRSEQRMRLKGFGPGVVMSRDAEGNWSEGAAFEAAKSFQGQRLGYVFKKGDRGVGYYADRPSVWRGKIRAGSRAASPLQIIQGDMFEVTPELVQAATFEKRGQFDLAFDRGGLVAVPPEARGEYVASTTGLLRKGGRLLLVTLDYDQSLVPIDPTGRRWSPPPFSVPESEVRRLFPADRWDIKVLDRQAEREIPANSPAFTGVEITEVVYLLTKKSDASAGGSMRTYLGGAALALTAAGVAAVALRQSGQ